MREEKRREDREKRGLREVEGNIFLEKNIPSQV
jgi:hypothetical protein